MLLLAVAISLDGFSVGFAYGIRNIKIPFRSIVTIASCSALVLLAAMGIGQMIEAWLSPKVAERLGGFILIAIGMWIVFQMLRSERQHKLIAKKNETMLVNLEIKSLGIVIQVLEKPAVADLDDSGTITGIEALILGLALSLDAFGAGISAALLGYSAFITAISVACMSSLFVLSGMKCGHLFSKFIWFRKFPLIPGLLLIVLGCFKL